MNCRNISSWGWMASLVFGSSQHTQIMPDKRHLYLDI